MWSRGRAIALFAVGVAAAILFGSVLAAYDIWGGVPRSLWRSMRGVAILSLTAMIMGGVLWIRSFPAGQRLRASLWTFLVVGLLGAVAGGGLFTYYGLRLDTSRKICKPARLLPHLADRQQELTVGLGPLFPVIDPAYDCIALKRELDTLELEGRCPMVVMKDTPCRCAKQRWLAKGPAFCDGAFTSCQWRPSLKRRALGCPEGEVQRLITAAKRLSARATK